MWSTKPEDRIVQIYDYICAPLPVSQDLKFTISQPILMVWVHLFASEANIIEEI